MRRRVLYRAAILAGALSVSACSSYEGIEALHGPPSDQDVLPVELAFAARSQGDFAERNSGTVTDYRFLVEDNRMQYFAGESDDYTTACIAVYPLDDPAMWGLGCGTGASEGEEAASTSSGTGAPAILVTTDFDADSLEDLPWRQIHENVLVSP